MLTEELSGTQPFPLDDEPIGQQAESQNGVILKLSSGGSEPVGQANEGQEGHDLISAEAVSLSADDSHGKQIEIESQPLPATIKLDGEPKLLPPLRIPEPELDLQSGRVIVTEIQEVPFISLFFAAFRNLTASDCQVYLASSQTGEALGERTLDEPPEPGMVSGLGEQRNFLFPTQAPPQTDWLAFLEGQYQRSTRESGSRIDMLMIDEIKRRGAEKRQLSLIDPLLRMIPFLTALLLLGALCLIFFTRTYLFLSDDKLHSRNFTFDVIELRDGGAAITLDNIAEIGAVVDSCEIAAQTTKLSNSSLLLSFSRELSPDGWFLVTKGSDPALDPTRFHVVATDGNASKQALHAAIKDVDITGTPIGIHIWRVDPPKERGQTRVTMHPARIVMVMRAVGHLVLALGSFVVVGFALRQHLRRARAAFALVLWALGLLSFIVAVVLSCRPLSLLSFSWWRSAVCLFVLAPCVGWSEIRLWLLAIVYVAVGLQAVLLVFETAVEAAEEAKATESGVRREVGDRLARLPLTFEFYQILLALCFAVALTVQRSRIIAKAQRSVRSLKEMLAAAWREELSKVGEGNEDRVLHEIADLVGLMSQGLQRKPHQRLTDKANLRHGKLGHLVHTPSVRSLDQLYAQAWGCSVLLRGKVKKLADHCDGMFARVGLSRRSGDRDSLFVRWEDAKGCTETEGEIEWTPLKPESRAVDKVLHHYLGDASRITDLCRETLVVGTLSNIADCLQAIMFDRQIQVERVKNYLPGPNGEEMDSHDSGGFRAIVLNFRIVNRESRALGLDGHICELLILPHSVACCLTEADPKLLQQLREAKATGALSRGLRHSIVSKWNHWRRRGRLPGVFWTLGKASSEAPSMGREVSWTLTPNGLSPQHMRAASPFAQQGSFRTGSLAPLPRSTTTIQSLQSGASEGQSGGRPPRSRRSSWQSGIIGSDGRASMDPSPRRLVAVGESPLHSPITQATQLSDAMLLKLTGGDSRAPERTARPRRHSDYSVQQTSASLLGATPVVDGPASLGATGSHKAMSGSFRAFRQVFKAGNSQKSLETVSHTTRSRSNSKASVVESGSAGAEDSGEVHPSGDRSGSSRQGRRSRRSRSGETRGSSTRGLSGMVRLGTDVISRFGSLVKTGGWRGTSAEATDAASYEESMMYPGRGQGQWYTLMERLYYERTQGLVEKLDEKKGHISAAVSSAEHLAVLKTSFPIPSAMCKSWFLAAALFLALMFVVSGGVAMARIAQDGGGQLARWVRFSVQAVRGETVGGAGGAGGVPVGMTAAVGGLGLVYGGCMENASAMGQVVRGEEGEEGAADADEWYIDLGAPAWLEGFFWQTSPLDPAKDPAVFEVKVSSDGAEWEVLAASQRSVRVGGVEQWSADEGTPFEAPIERHAVVLVDSRTPWYLWLAGPVPELTQGVGWLVLSACGCAHQRRWLDKWLRRRVSGVEFWLVLGNKALGLGFVAAAVSLVVSAAAQSAMGTSGKVPLGLNWAWAMVAASVALVVCRAARYLIEALTVAGLARIALRLSDAVLHPSQLSVAQLGVEVDVVAWILFVCGLSLILYKWNAKRVATRDVRVDVLNYAGVWTTLSEQNAEGLATIQRNVDAIAENIAPWMPVRQEYLPEQRPTSNRKKSRSRFFGDSGGERRSSATFKSLMGSSVRNASGKRGSLSLLGRGSISSWRGTESVCSEAAAALDLDESIRRLNSRGPETPDSPPPLGLRRVSSALEVDTALDESVSKSTHKLESPSEYPESNFSSWPQSQPVSDSSRPKSSSRLMSSTFRRRPSWHQEHRKSSQHSVDAARALSLNGSDGGANRTPFTAKRDSCVSRDSEGSQVQLVQKHRDSFLSSGDAASSILTHDADAEGLATPVRGRLGHGRGSDPGPLNSPYLGSGRLRRHSVTEASGAGGLRELLRQKVPFLFVHPAVAAVKRAHGARPTPQRNSRSSSVRTTFFKRGEFGAQDEYPPVDSLEQLFAQAKGLYPVLKAKVQCWAAQTDGMFPVNEREDSEQRFCAWNHLVSLHGEEGAETRVKWASLKNSERAIEKLVRSYEGRVCRLLDICRQSIIFDEPEQLAQCLSQIREDQEVEVLAIKNRLRHDYDAGALSLGYRDVNINLRIINETTKKHGTHPHVCEVQLLLKSFSEYKSDAGHKRYVAFRNARGK